MLSASLPTVGGPLPPKPVSTSTTLPPVLIAVTVNGLSNLSGPMPAGGQRLLDVVERGILDEVGVQNPLDAAVMQAEDLDVADLVFEAVGGALRMRRADE